MPITFVRYFIVMIIMIYLKKLIGCDYYELFGETLLL